MITAASMLLPLVDVLGFHSPMGLVIAMLACAAGGFMVFMEMMIFLGSGFYFRNETGGGI